MSELLEFAQAVAQQGAAILRDRYESVLDVSTKSSEVDLVTDVDQAAEALMLGHIHTRFPDYLVYAEETAQDEAVLVGGRPVWVVDPLDGTVNYAHGVPVFSVSVALVVGGRPVVGVIVDPLRDEMFWAEQGQGAWLNGRRLRVTTRAHLGEALLATGFPYSRATERDNNLDAFNYLMPRTRGVRRAGSACLDMAWTAAGRFDGYWEMYLKPYDWAAGWLLVEEAGGRVTDFDGQPWSMVQPVARMVATNGHLHDDLLAALRTARQKS